MAVSHSVHVDPPDPHRTSLSALTVRVDAAGNLCEGSQTARSIAMRTTGGPSSLSTKPQSRDASELQSLDRRYVFHPFTQLDQHEQSNAPVIVEGDGVTLRSSDGRTYLDAMAGLWCVNVGYGRAEIGEALRDEAALLGSYHAFSSMASDLPAPSWTR